MDIGVEIFSLAPHLMERAKRSSEYVMIQCPYHGGGQENTASCVVSLTKPVFCCHACQTSGHVSKLLRTLGARGRLVDMILRKAGFSGGRAAPEAEERDTIKLSQKRRYNIFEGPFQVPESALDEFRLPATPLLKKGFTPKTLRHFEVGFDLASSRITFPIRNVYGGLVGISGRTTLDKYYDDAQGVDEAGITRYKIYKKELIDRGVVPPDYTMDGVKEAVLWHGHVARPFLMGTEEPVIITEGFKACMWVWQAGYKSVVALIGAYLTTHHAELISRVTKTAYLLLDNNPAGKKGTLSAGITLRNKGVDVQVCTYLDDRQQPDDYTVEEIDQILGTTQGFYKWRRENEAVHARILRRWEDAKRRRARQAAPRAGW